MPERATAAVDAALDRALPLLDPEAREAGEVSAAGYLDVLGPSEPRSTGWIQYLMHSDAVPRVYERWWRPALGRVAKGLFGPGMGDELRIARLLLSLAPGDGVLDVACGTGNFSRSFAATVGEDGLVVGVDVSETMLDRAVADTRKAGLDVAYVRGDAQELPFRSRSFDAVCCFAALHLFADPMRALDRMTDVLTPGGRLALVTSVRGRALPLRAGVSLVTRRSGARLFERDELVHELETRGFGELRQRVTGITQFIGGRLSE